MVKSKIIDPPSAIRNPKSSLQSTVDSPQFPIQTVDYPAIRNSQSEKQSTVHSRQSTVSNSDRGLSRNLQSAIGAIRNPQSEQSAIRHPQSAVKIAPSLLAADFSDLAREVKRVELGGCDLIHFDIMDGHFVPNITMGPMVIAALRDKTNIPFDVHLMIENPGKYVDSFIKAGANIITVHAETCLGFTYVVDYIRKQGVRAGLAINPGTPLAEIESYLDRVDFYLLMTVNPGFGGQEFMPDVLPKISALRQLCLKRGLEEVDIEVDGGITQETAPRVVKEGANVLVAGSAIFNSPDPSAEVARIRQAARAV